MHRGPAMASLSALSCREWMLASVSAFLAGAICATVGFLLGQPSPFAHRKIFWPLSSLLPAARDNNCGYVAAQRRKSNSMKSSKTNSDCKCGKSQTHDSVLNGTLVARRDAELFSNIVSRKTESVNGCVKADPFDASKREGYLSWDDYFMAIAFLSAHRSKDPNRQVGACLVSQDRVILGIGYNGFPRGCSDDLLPWAKISVNGDPLQTKYPYVCHAEVNAILNKNHASAYGQRLYVTMFPCNECAKIIIQAGVAEVVYFIDKNGSSSDYSYIASQRLLLMAGVKVWQHQPAQQKIIVEFK